MNHIRLIYLAMLFISCNHQKTKLKTEIPGPKSRYSVHVEEKISSESTTTKCIDSLKMAAQKIKYYKVNTMFPNKWKYSLEVEKTNVNEQIKSAIFFYSSFMFEEACERELDYFELDSIQLMLRDKTQTLNFNSSVWAGIEGFATTTFNLVDINFDGYPDLELYLNLVSGEQNVVNRYYIFNPNTMAYSKGIDLVNLNINPETKELTQHWTGGHAGKIGGQVWMDVVGYDSVSVIKRVTRGFDDSLKAYINTYETLVDNQILTTKTDTIRE